MSEWFSAKELYLNLDKRNVIKCIIRNSPQYTLNIGYNDKDDLITLHSMCLGGYCN
jgi:hypothetical protein